MLFDSPGKHSYDKLCRIFDSSADGGRKVRRVAVEKRGTPGWGLISLVADSCATSLFDLAFGWAYREAGT
jgi:hypothetical protein